jgi:hypothetical protein
MLMGRSPRHWFAPMPTVRATADTLANLCPLRAIGYGRAQIAQSDGQVTLWGLP